MSRTTLAIDAYNVPIQMLQIGAGQPPVTLTATGVGNSVVTGSAIDADTVWIYCDTDGVRIDAGPTPDARAPADGKGKRISAGLLQLPWKPAWKLAICGAAGATVDIWPALDAI